MPFSLVIEALAQTAAFTGITDENSLGLLSSVKKAEKLGAAMPGDRLDLTFEVTRNRRGFVFGHAKRQWAGSLLLKLKSAFILKNEKNPSQHL